MEKEKKCYTTPKLIIYGNVSQITQHGGAPNADVSQGPDNTAYSPG